jgi:hypothetical protein
VKEMNDVQPSAQCITAHAGFHEVCLSVYALRTAYKAYRQRYGDIQGDLNRLRDCFKCLVLFLH